MAELLYRSKCDREVIVKHQEHAWAEARVLKAAGFNTPAESVAPNAASVLNASAALARSSPAEKS